MRIVLDLGDRRETVQLRAWQRHATLRDLVAQRRRPPANRMQLTIDGVPRPDTTPLDDAGLWNGTVISDGLAAEPSDPQPEPAAGWHVAVSGGLDTAPAIPLTAHARISVGRSPQAVISVRSESVSWEHCSFAREGAGVRVRDAGSTNGTFVEGHRIDGDGVVVTSETLVRAGSVVLTVGALPREVPAIVAGAACDSGVAGTVPLNRPPLPDPAPGSSVAGRPVRAPHAKDVPEAGPLNLVTVLAPLVAAGVMVAVIGDLRFVLFAALSPVLAVGTYIEQRRRRGKLLRAEESRFSGELAGFAAAMGAARAEERHRRQRSAPDPATVVRRALLSATNLWERRIGADGFLQFHLGVGDLPWAPPLTGHDGADPHDRVRAFVDGSVVRDTPITADLTGGGVIGIVGSEPGARALARSLVVQAAAHCGPADLAIGVWCDRGRAADWEWAGWLPHTHDVAADSGQRWLGDEPGASANMLRRIRDTPGAVAAPAMLAVIDSDTLTRGQDSAARLLLGAGGGSGSLGGAARSWGVDPAAVSSVVSGIVLAATARELPAVCSVVVEVDADGAGIVRSAGGGGDPSTATVAGVSVGTATTFGRRIARFEDPEIRLPHAQLPGRTRLLDLLTDGPLTTQRVQDLWARSTGLSTPIGIAGGGVATVDLLADGPHGLVGGTTGSGKSEFLRSLVLGLALRTDPTQLNFILVDFKGGAAFAACERLPHTVGTVSNLDAALAHRAVRALEAELGRRQRLFAAAGDDVDSLTAYLATNPAEPLPRLVLVVDEFAILAREFPDVLTALVNVAAVGRTLGVHMVLATQRPAGVVTEDILANTNLRVALRVQSSEDSRSVIGVADAAEVSRRHPGRAYIRLGEGDVTPVQTALVAAPPEADRTLIEVVETGVFGVPLTPGPGDLAVTTAPAENELERVIEVVAAASNAAGFAAPRPVWPAPLGPRVDAERLGQIARLPSAEASGSVPGVAVVALADEPGSQRQVPTGWDPAAGNLLLIGIAGSGTSTALAGIAIALARAVAPDALDLLCLDYGSEDLRVLAALPHTHSYAGSGPDARERQLKLLRYIAREAQRRRETPGPHRATVVLIDGFAALRDELQDPAGQDLFAEFVRAYGDGPGLGISFAVATTRARAVPAAMEEMTTQRWVFRLPDLAAYAALDLRGGDVPAAVPGRCIDASTRRHMQIAAPGSGMAAAVEHTVDAWPGFPVKREIAAALPQRVTCAMLSEMPRLVGSPVRIPVGIREESLSTAHLELYEGEHALIAGPARSGKSSLLIAIAETLTVARSREAPPEMATGPTDTGPPWVWGIAHRRSPLDTAPFDRFANTPDEIAELVADAARHEHAGFLLVDDAERLTGSAPALEQILGAPPSGLHLIVAGQAAELRSRYGDWTTTIRAARCGILLQPDIDYDGDLLGVRVPRQAPVPLSVGRGYMCTGGAAALVQAAAGATPAPAQSQTPALAMPAVPPAAPGEDGAQREADAPSGPRPRTSPGGRAARRRERAYARTL